MSIFSRINRVIQSSVNDLIDKMTDPGKEIDLLILDMEKGLREAREEVRQTLVGVKRAEIECGKAQEKVELWQGRAEKAVRSGDDELARQALVQRLGAERERAAAEQARSEQEAQVARLRDASKELEQRLREVQLRKETFKQRARAAKQGQRGIAGSEAFERFDALQARIEALEETAEVTQSFEQRDVATDAAFRRLEASQGDAGIDAELAALKRKAQLGPASAAGAPAAGVPAAAAADERDELARLKRELDAGKKTGGGS